MNRGSRNWQPSASRERMAFNEAPIHESGKSRMGITAAGREALPSMRPRFMNRGSQCRILGRIF